MNGHFPPQFSGFEHVKRYWDKGRHQPVAKVLPGEFYVSQETELISTVLGSCIAACIYDPLRRIGGLNHFMLPVGSEHSVSFDSESARYGNWAMEYLINEILKHGGRREALKVKLFGGGRIIRSMTDVGEGNILFAREYVKREGFELVSEDVGGPWPRKILFHPTTGRVQVKRLRSMHNDTIEKREEKYLHQVAASNKQSDIELF